MVVNMMVLKSCISISFKFPSNGKDEHAKLVGGFNPSEKY